MVSPELMLFIDIGGMELVFGFLTLYYQNIIVWFERKIMAMKAFISITQTVLTNSVLGQSKVLSFHAVYCTVVFSMTGSLLFSMSFFTPALFIGS